MRLVARFLALLVLVALPSVARAQTSAIERVEEALARGDADALSALGAERVDVAFGGTATTYSRAQVRYVLAGFLEANPPLSFAFDDRIASGDDATLASGRYRTDGHVYQVMARFGRRDGTWELRELRIDG